MTYATIMTKRDDLKEATGVSEQSKNTVAQSLQLSNALAVGETTTLEINVVLKKPPTTNARRKGITAASVLQKLLRRCQKITSIVHSLVQSQLRKNQNWIATINTNGHNTVFKLDTGAEVTAISAETFQEMGNIQLSKTSKVLYGPSRRPPCQRTVPGEVHTQEWQDTTTRLRCCQRTQK